MPTFIRVPSSVQAFHVDGHSWQDDGLYAGIDHGTGNRRDRRVWTAAPRTYAVSWVLTDAQMQAVDRWFENDLQVGVRHFIAKVRTEPGIQFYEAAWVEPYVADPIGRPEADLAWRVTGSIVTFGDPTDTAPETGELFAEYGFPLDAEAYVAGAAALFAEYGFALELESAALFAEYGFALTRFAPYFLLIGDGFRLLLDDTSDAANLLIE